MESSTALAELTHHDHDLRSDDGSGWTQSLDVCMKPDRLDPARTDEDVKRILELVVEVRLAWEHAVDGGVYPLSSVLGESRHTGFSDHDPTHSAATRPTQWQLRSSAKRAAVLISIARERLEDAAWVLKNGMLMTDPDEWIHHQEKRSAVLDR